MSDSKTLALNPFDVKMTEALKRDPDILVIGEASEETRQAIEGVTVVMGSYDVIHAGPSPLARKKLRLQLLAFSHPAESEVALRMLDRDSKVVFPANVRRLMRNRSLPKITWEEPMEYDLSRFSTEGFLTQHLARKGGAENV